MWRIAQAVLAAEARYRDISPPGWRPREGRRTAGPPAADEHFGMPTVQYVREL